MESLVGTLVSGQPRMANKRASADRRCQQLWGALELEVFGYAKAAAGQTSADHLPRHRRVALWHADRG